MTNRIRQIQIGTMESKKNTIEAITKTKEILEKAIEESKSIENIAALLDIILDTVSEVIKTEETQKVFSEVTKGLGYTTAEIESVNELVKNAFKQLPASSKTLLKLTADDFKKIASWHISINK